MSQPTVFITGAATGIGMATAHILSDKGWRVFAGHLPGQSVADLTRGGSGPIQLIPIDTTDDELVTAAARAVSEAVGGDGLSALINNAAVADIGSGVLAGVDLEAGRRLFEINVWGTLRVTQAFLPLIHQGRPGRIINMSSGAVRVPVPTAGIYNMSKFAIEGFTKTLRYELAPFGIEVVAIEPGGVRTPMTHGAEDSLARVWEGMGPEIRARYESVLRPANEKLVQALEEANEPEDIAAIIASVLASPKTHPRYVAGKEVKFLPAIQRLLPERTFEDVLLKQFGLSRGAARSPVGG